MPNDRDALHHEVQAQAIAWGWCDEALKDYNKVAKHIVDSVEEARTKEAAEIEAREGFRFEEGDKVLTHFKAKGKDGKPAKSKSSKEALVLAAADDQGLATVQFAHNGVRHQVPRDWVVGRAPAEDGSTPPPRRARPAAAAGETNKDGAPLSAIDWMETRGRMTLEVFHKEAAIIEVMYRDTQLLVKSGWSCLDEASKGNEKAALDSGVEFQKTWLALQDKRRWVEEQVGKVKAEAEA